MVRFHDAAEMPEKADVLSPTGFHEIQPRGDISKTQVQEFVNSLFHAEVDYRHMDEAEMMAEVYGRDEDEFSFDFEVDDSMRSLLQNFDEDKWEDISDGERKILVKELAAALADRLGIDSPPEVRFIDAPAYIRGAYDPQDRVVEINGKCLGSPAEVIDTLVHEMRHAYQHQHALTPENKMDALYKYNFEHYISPVRDADGNCLFFTDYQDQLVEAEARAFANHFIREAFG